MNFMFLNRYKDGGRETTPVVVNLERLNFFYPWDGRNEGTFVAVGDGSMVVKESFEEIVSILKGEK